MNTTTMLTKFTFPLLLLVTGWLTGCNSDNELSIKNKDLVITFHHQVDGLPVLFDNMAYTNAAGNLFEVTEIQWFISDLELLSEDGEDLAFQGEENTHYIDTNLPGTLSWQFREQVPARTYHAIRFTFGLRAENNTVARFTEAPEINMIWPYHMGGDNGGFHYMKLNGFWMDTLNIRQPFNFHLGVGKTMENEAPVFHQNWFEVTLNLEEIDFSDEQSVFSIPIVMNIENWFENPHSWDFDDVGGRIMNNQTAMKMGCENGAADVFSIVTP